MPVKYLVFNIAVMEVGEEDYSRAHFVLGEKDYIVDHAGLYESFSGVCPSDSEFEGRT